MKYAMSYKMSRAMKPDYLNVFNCLSFIVQQGCLEHVKYHFMHNCLISTLLLRDLLLWCLLNIGILPPVTKILLLHILEMIIVGSVQYASSNMT